MHPTFVRRCVLPLMMRRTWPRVVERRAALEKSQWLPAADLRALQEERLREVVELAARRCPFWRERLREAGVGPSDVRGLQDLQRIPVLEKCDLQRHGARILREDASPEAITWSATGGTTGEPTRYAWDDEYWCASSAVSARAGSTTGFEPGDRHCMIWGTAFHETRGAAWREHLQQRLRNVLVVPGFDLSAGTLARWTERVVRHRPVLVEGYTSLLVLFAEWLLARGDERIRPRAVVSSAEKLHDHQRELVGRAFGAPVFDRYGSREVGCIAHECERGTGLHVQAEHVIVEVVRGGRPAAPGESGEILVTSLSNRVFPFLRYRIGDVGALLEEPCACGRGLPMMRVTEGRTHDLITTARGTWLPGEFFPHMFKEFPGVAAFQVHQAADRSVTLRIVKGEAFEEAQERRYVELVRDALGADLPLTVEHVSELARGRSGKLRFTTSDVPVDLLGAAVDDGGRAP